MQRFVTVVGLVCVGVGTLFGQGRTNRVRTVLESAREIPLAYDVDVIVVGGSTRGVAAAVAAAEEGARVFLLEDRPYLGADMCATSRLWLEPDEMPKHALARTIFSSGASSMLGKGMPFSYVASREAAAKHPETKGAGRLRDGELSGASENSIQYDGAVEIVADLGAERELMGLELFAFQRLDDFAVGEIRLAVSDDGEHWRKAVELKNANTREGIEGAAKRFFGKLTGRARYVKVDVSLADKATRLLLAELKIHGTTKEEPVTKARMVTTPMKVKRALDDALLSAKVDFLYGSYATDILRDEQGALGGIVMANRSGRQAVRGKVVIDATDRGVVARLAGARFTEYPRGNQQFSRIVIGGKPNEGAVDLGIVYDVGTRVAQPYKVYEYKFDLPMRDGSWASFARADQAARDRTWQSAQVSGAESLFHVGPDAVRARRQQRGEWQGADAVELEALMPSGVDDVYVLSARADVSREAAAALLRPLNGMRLGARVGSAAAVASKARSVVALAGLRVAGGAGVATVTAEVGEMLDGLRWKKPDGAMRSVASPARSLPVLGRYDTVIAGGGTGGAPAGIGAARGGARTLVIEYLHGLGGVGTLGRISKYYHGNRVGFTSEIDKGVVELSSGKRSNKGWNIEAKMEWLRSEIVKAGGDVWFHCLAVGSVMQGNQFVGIVVATPQGRGVILANSVIDATGNAVIPACAGLPTQRITGEHMSVQGTGLPPYTPGESYQNSDWTFVDDDDVLDMWRIHVVAKKKYANAFDLGQLIDTRARRRIVGDLIVSPMDIINKRVYSDVITVSKSNFDNHGFSSHDLFMVTPPDKKGLVGNVPYRALLPKGYDGILVTGLGMSAHGDAMPVMRMQPDVQNHAYAAGRASAMVAEAGTSVRNVDMLALQKHLVEKGIIPKSMIGADDTYLMGPEKLATAVKGIGKDYSGISAVLTQRQMALPLLRTAYDETEDEAAKLRYAHVLGMMHDATGADSLIAAVGAAKWDKGWNFRGMGQFGATTSQVDNLVIALGRTGDKRALPVLIEKLNQLTAKSEFSHCRAVAMALETLRSPQAAPPLAALLGKVGVRGHAFLEVHDVIKRSPASMTDNSTRNNSLRELVLARALFRCGDHQNLAKNILTEYGADFRGHYASHAQAILAEKH